ncbi:MAG: hypothetical protein AAFX01_08695 [Cyanobacteria bacterium J06638_28]
MHLRESDSSTSSNSFVAHSEDLSLTALHEMLSQLQSEPSSKSDEIALIKERIRNLLPQVDTGRALPQKKTPHGRTKVLHLNYIRSQADEPVELEMAYVRFVAQTVQALGLRLEILTHKAGRDDVEQELTKDEYKGLEYVILTAQNPVSKWAEDSVEYLSNGQPAVLTPFDDQLLAWAMTAGRRHRWQGMIAPENLEEALQDDHLWILLGTRVNTLKTGRAREQAAQAQGQNVGHIRAYIEGGNLITGEDAMGNPVILVGKDAIDATAYLYQLNQDEVKQLIREDFGLAGVSQVIGVEQPGKFHLDMGMLFIGQGVVIVNDSREAFKEAKEMAEMVPCLTTEKMAAKLQLQSALEEAAANDLQVAGIEVRRAKLENDVDYNFFNGEFVAGKDGLSYYLTNGGSKEQADWFQTLMVEDWQVVDEVIFTPPAIAQKSLQDQGGIGCRLKGSQR